MKKYSVIIPTLNEAENIQKIVDSFDDIYWYIENLDLEMIIVDDTNDNSVKDICDKTNWIKYIRGCGNYGEALIFGLNHSIGNKVIIMDADHPISYIGKMFKLLDVYDAIIGVEDKSNKERKVTRWLCKNFLGLDFPHPTCGFMGFTRNTLKIIPYCLAESEHDFAHVEFLKMCSDKKLKIGTFSFSGHKGSESYSLKRCLTWLWDFMMCYLFPIH